MISKERLEELIGQGATIYWICGKDVEKKPLKHKYHKFYVLDNELYEDNEKLGIGIWKHKLSKLFETNIVPNGFCVSARKLIISLSS